MKTKVSLAARRVPSMLGFADRLLGSDGAGLIALDRDFRFIFWSDAMDRIAGMSADEVLGRRAGDVFSFVSELEGQLARALAGETVAIKRRHYSFAEREGFLDGYLTPFTDEEGEIVGVVWVVHDLTAQKRTEERLGEIERRFQNMADAAPVLLWMSETDGLCTFFTKLVEATNHYNPVEDGLTEQSNKTDGSGDTKRSAGDQ